MIFKFLSEDSILSPDTILRKENCPVLALNLTGTLDIGSVANLTGHVSPKIMLQMKNVITNPFLSDF